MSGIAFEYLLRLRNFQRAKNDFGDNDRAERTEMKSFRLLLHRLEQDEERQRRIVRKRLDVIRREPAIGGGGRRQPVTKLLDAEGAIAKQPRLGDELRPAGGDFLDQGVDRPHPGNRRAQQIPIEQADALGGVERRENVVAAERVAQIRTDAPAEVRPRPVDLEEARPLHHPALVQRHVDGLVDRVLLQRVAEIVLGQIVDAIFRAHHGMAEAERAVREFERHLPLAGGRGLIHEARVASRNRRHRWRDAAPAASRPCG